VAVFTRLPKLQDSRDLRVLQDQQDPKVFKALQDPLAPKDPLARKDPLDPLARKALRVQPLALSSLSPAFPILETALWGPARWI
jgi:hypothetical protein